MRPHLSYEDRTIESPAVVRAMIRPGTNHRLTKPITGPRGELHAIKYDSGGLITTVEFEATAVIDLSFIPEPERTLIAYLLREHIARYALDHQVGDEGE